ncbi:MAG: hypothetical protein LLG00_01015 [Planctomycetaceae bacterium]|nr:hypothetical protein [Planctomycetaceae bacterium]
MQSGTVPPQVPPQQAPSAAPPTEYEAFIDQRLHQTRRRVKGVDLANALVTLSIGVVAYLLVAALADHWLVTGGLGIWARTLCWLLLVAAGGSYVAYRVLPPLLHRVNPVFAAATIEKSQPSLRNSLINFLLLRGRREQVAVPVFQAIEYRAAVDLSKVRLEGAVDRTRLVRQGAILCGLVAVCFLYLAFSEKSFLRSAERVLWPWTPVAAPTRVSIRDIEPGRDTVTFHGESLTVSAEIKGLREAEQPVLVYTTADGQSVNQAIPMTLPEGQFRYRCQLPPGNVGLQQDCRYYLKAGDTRTPTYQVTVQIPPAIVVDAVTYHYPDYTGLADQTVERQGDLRAIEGTEVTIHATANTDIKPASAEIDLGCTGRHTLSLTVSGRTAIGQLTLRLNPDDPTQAEYDSYQLLFTDAQGNKNLRPIRNHIDVVRDLPPEVQLIEPGSEEVQVAEDGRLTIKVRSEDPDFALRRVTLRAVRDDRSLSIPPLLDRRPPAKAVSGEFQGTYLFEPSRLGLKAGDRVQYWAEAEDNREPAANHAATEKQWITVVGPEANRRPQAKPDGAKGTRNDQRGDQGKSQPRQRDGTPSKPDEQSPDQQSPDQRAAKQPAKPGQPEEAKPDQQQPQSPDQQPSDGKQGDGKQQGQKSGQGNEDAGQQGNSKPDGKQDGKDSGKQDANEKGDQQSTGPQKGNQQQGQNGGEQGDKQKAAESPDNQRTDPDAAPGDAMQKIINDLEQQQKNQGTPDKGQSTEQKSEQPGDQQQPGGKQQQNGNQPGADQQQPGAKQQPAEQQKPGGNQQRGDQQQPGGKQQNGEQQPGGKQQNGGNENPSGDQQPQQGNNQQPGNQDGNQNAGPKQPGTDTRGSKPSGDAKQGTEESPSGQAGQKPDAKSPSGKKHGPNDLGKAEANQGEKQPASESPDKRSGKPTGAPEQGDKGPAKEKPNTDVAGGADSGNKPSGKPEQPAAGPGKSTAKPKPGDAGTPLPQDANQPKKPSDTAASPADAKGDDAKSPSTSKRQSDAKGQTSGDRSGQGAEGGGQKDKKPGVGEGGANTPADQGSANGNEPGEGDVGSKPGDQTPSKSPTDSKNKAATPGGSSGDAAKASTTDQKPTGKPADQDKPGKPGTPSNEPAKGGAPPTGESSQSPGPGLAPAGGPGDKLGPNGTAQPPEDPADEANLDYARRQTALALQHLRDQLAKEKAPLLDRLGWTKDEARRFLARWEEMQRAAAESGDAGRTARKQLNDALKSLGLRLHGTQLRRGATTQDRPQNLRESGRFAPPPDWAEQVREYTRGVAGAERREDAR